MKVRSPSGRRNGFQTPAPPTWRYISACLRGEGVVALAKARTRSHVLDGRAQRREPTGILIFWHDCRSCPRQRGRTGRCRRRPRRDRGRARPMDERGRRSSACGPSEPISTSAPAVAMGAWRCASRLGLPLLLLAVENDAPPATAPRPRPGGLSSAPRSVGEVAGPVVGAAARHHTLTSSSRGSSVRGLPSHGPAPVEIRRLERLQATSCQRHRSMVTGGLDVECRTAAVGAPAAGNLAHQGRRPVPSGPRQEPALASES